jgi:CheY-like chemotaxis protein
MEQALLDLFTHCRDRAAPEGRLTITTRRLVLDEARRGRYLQRFAEVTVADTGPSLRGVPVETLFEPSWTHSPGHPAGLSLFALRTLLGSARGHLTVESESDTGARFVIRLPEMEEENMPVQATKTPGVRPTILLVEDDDNVRVLLHNSLKKRGHMVIEARDGEEALMQSDFHDGPIDLLISDVVMPRTNGVKLARELVRRRPETKLLLISGCPDDVADIQDLVKIGAHYVQKPFSQRDLVARAEAMLSDKDFDAQGA